MRKIIVLEFITLDGVIQGGGGPEEDTSGGFAYGGWQVPYSDDAVGAAMNRQMNGSFARTQNIRYLGSLLAETLGLLAGRDVGDQIRCLKYADFS